MPVLANIVVNDGAATPVAHTFKPVSASVGLAKFVDRKAGIPVTFDELSIGDNQGSATGAVDRVTLKMRLPATAVNADTGVTELVNSAEADVFLRLPRTGSTQSRDDLIELIRNTLADAIVRSVVVDRETVY